MKKVGPREFRNAFLAVMKAEHESFRAAVGFEPKSYAWFVRSSIFPKIARQLGLLAWNKDYCTLDGMFYEERGRDKSGKYTTYAKWISVALQHANKPADTHEDLSKLQIFNAPLKVLITYVADGDDTESLLRKYESVIREADVFDDIATLRVQLVILGTPRSARDWRFYVYEKDGFVLMLG